MNEIALMQNWLVLGTGFVFGMRHALDADHLAAVSAIVSEQRGWRRSSLIGAWWGLGHTLSLLGAGVLVLIFKAPIDGRVENALEFCVGLMLIGLGGNALWRWRRTRTPEHVHLSELSIGQASQADRTGRRPLLIGLLHGLAGSAALLLLVLSTIEAVWLGFLYLLVFGVGSIGGMMMMSSLLSLPFVLTATRFHKAHHAVQLLAALFSIGCGLLILHETSQFGQ